MPRALAFGPIETSVGPPSHVRSVSVRCKRTFAQSVGAPVWQEWETTLEVSHEWKERVKPLLRLFAERTPGAYVEEKSISLSWHYAKARPTAAAVPYRLSIESCSA